MLIEKDVITPNNFLKDFIGATKFSEKETRLWLLFSTPLSIAVVCAFFASTGAFKIFFGFLAFITVFTFWAAFSIALRNRKLSKTIAQNDYKIVTAKVIERYEEIIPTKYRSGRPNILVFENYGNFNIPEGVNFSSATQYSMRETEFFRTSLIGDVFYLIVDNQNKILIAYNTKYFELRQ